MKIIADKNSSLKDMLNTGTVLNGKYFYLPFWFEDDGDNFIIHKLEDDMPTELKSVIKDFTEAINTLKKTHDSKSNS